MGLDPAAIMFMLVPLARVPMPGAEIVAIDPAGRGFAALCVVPTSYATRHGEIALLDL
jgi:hypothetical protein